MPGRKPAIHFALFTLLLEVMGFGLIIPVLPKLVTGMGGGDVSSGSATFGWFAAVYAMTQFLCGPVLGSLSDVYGRRPIILISLVGAAADYALLAWAPSLTWLFVGRIIHGVTGAAITTVAAYIADVSPMEKRAQNFGLMGAMFGLGFILGPAAGGLLGNLGPRVPFVAAAALNLLNALYGFLALPESLSKENRRAFRWSAANPLTTLAVLGRNRFLQFMTLALVGLNMAQMVFQSTWVLYTTYRFSWTELQNGISLSVVGLGAAVVQGGLTRKVIPRLGEGRTLILGVCVSGVAFLLYGLATQGWMIYPILFLGALGGLSGPAAQSLMTRAVGPTEQGALQGAMTSLMSLSGVVGPVVFTQLFGAFTAPDAPVIIPGIAFFAGDVFLALGVLAAVKALALAPKDPLAGTLVTQGPATSG